MAKLVRGTRVSLLWNWEKHSNLQVHEAFWVKSEKNPQRFSASNGSQFLLTKQVQPKISSRNPQLNVLKYLRKKA